MYKHKRPLHWKSEGREFLGDPVARTPSSQDMPSINLDIHFQNIYTLTQNLLGN